MKTRRTSVVISLVFGLGVAACQGELHTGLEDRATLARTAVQGGSAQGHRHRRNHRGTGGNPTGGIAMGGIIGGGGTGGNPTGGIAMGGIIGGVGTGGVPLGASWWAESQEAEAGQSMPVVPGRCVPASRCQPTPPGIQSASLWPRWSSAPPVKGRNTPSAQQSASITGAGTAGAAAGAERGRLRDELQRRRRRTRRSRRHRGIPTGDMGTGGNYRQRRVRRKCRCQR